METIQQLPRFPLCTLYRRHLVCQLPIYLDGPRSRGSPAPPRMPAPGVHGFEYRVGIFLNTQSRSLRPDLHYIYSSSRLGLSGALCDETVILQGRKRMLWAGVRTCYYVNWGVGVTIVHSRRPAVAQLLLVFSPYLVSIIIVL